MFTGPEARRERTASNVGLERSTPPTSERADFLFLLAMVPSPNFRGCAVANALVLHVALSRLGGPDKTAQRNGPL